MNLKSQRNCGDCTACCEGWLSANVYGHIMKPGTKCHFLGRGCTIYGDRPQGCAEFKCVWLEDTEYLVPEWIKPSLSKIIIMKNKWGQNNEFTYWRVVECGEKMNSEVLHWLLTFCEMNNICLEYQFNRDVHRKGTREFHEYMSKMNEAIKV